MGSFINLTDVSLILSYSLREKYRCSKVFWSVFSLIWTEYRPEKLRIPTLLTQWLRLSFFQRIAKYHTWIRGVQKLSSRGVLRTPMPKCDFNKVALQFYWNSTLPWVFSCKFAGYLQFPNNTSRRLFLGLIQNFIIKLHYTLEIELAKIVRVKTQKLMIRKKQKVKVKYKKWNNNHNNDVNKKSIKTYHLHLFLLNRAAVLRVC